MLLKEVQGKEREAMKKGVVEKIVKKAAYRVAETSANRICVYFFHQPKLPKAVKQLRKF